MPPFGKQSPENRRIDWLGIVRTLLVQVLVLLALSGAIVGYLRWSSDTNWAEFVSADKAPVLDAKHHPLFSASIRAVNGRTSCDRRD